MQPAKKRRAKATCNKQLGNPACAASANIYFGATQFAIHVFLLFVLVNPNHVHTTDVVPLSVTTSLLPLQIGFLTNLITFLQYLLSHAASPLLTCRIGAQVNHAHIFAFCRIEQTLMVEIWFHVNHMFRHSAHNWYGVRLLCGSHYTILEQP